MSNRQNRSDKILLKIIDALVLMLFIFMFIVIMIGVVSRYFFNAPVFGTEEVARTMMFYMVMLGSAVAIRRGRHPSLSFIIQKFPPRFLQKWNLFIDSIMLFVLIVLFIQGCIITHSGIPMKMPALRISFFWVYLAFPVGALAMISQLIAKHFFDNKLQLERERDKVKIKTSVYS